MFLESLFAIFILAVGVKADDYHFNIECPFPEGQDVSSVAECAKYSACEWDTLYHCHMKKNLVAGYGVLGPEKKTAAGSKVTLKKIDPSVTLFHDDIPKLVFEVIDHEDYHVQIKIYDDSKPRYEVPVPLNLPETPTENPLYVVKYSKEGEPFQFSVGRKGSPTEDELFNMIGALTYEDQFLQLTTTLVTDYMYGMGENTHSSFKHVFSPRQTFPIFPRDHEVVEGIINLYGHHPYYINVDPDTEQVHSVLLHNSNAIEYSTFLLSDGTPALTLRTIGGILDLHFFLGPSLEDVNRQYINMIGLPIMPPYWSMGFQLSRDGYRNPDHIREIRKRMKDNEIPQDVQFFDVDYMSDRRDFTYDPTDWEYLPELIEELHNEGLKVTLILDPPIASDFDKYPPGQRGKDADVFIKWSSESYIPDDQDPSWGDYMVGRVWPSYPAVFPDFFNPVTQQWWADEMEMFHGELDYDAIWIDMNEVTNFGTNQISGQNNYPNKTDLLCPDNRFDSPPYPTMMTRVGGSVSQRISEQTICMSGNQTDGENHYIHYDVHALYGWSHTIATNKAMRRMAPGKRPMVLTRSTFPGTGPYAFHWLGDNGSVWEHLKMSIIGILEFNLFGMPMVGADICGFNGDATEELCLRWMQLGAFYPYSRNHNCGDNDQDPAVWPTVAESSSYYIQLRYALHPYLYSLFRRAHLYGESVARPLFSQFLSDRTALEIDDQFFWGNGLMIAPVLSANTTSRDVYFPKGQWYNMDLTEKITGPVMLKVPTSWDYLPAYFLGGTIFPSQEPGLTTTESRKNKFGLLVALNSSLEAEGEIFWDDGESDFEQQEVYLASTWFSDNILRVDVLSSPTLMTGKILRDIQLWGYPFHPIEVKLNGGELSPVEWYYDAGFEYLWVGTMTPLDKNITVEILL